MSGAAVVRARLLMDVAEYSWRAVFKRLARVGTEAGGGEWLRYGMAVR
jgi:hypothetical protein